MRIDFNYDNFCELFTIALRKQGITNFDGRKLSDKLETYSNNLKYRKLFQAIENEHFLSLDDIYKNQHFIKYMKGWSFFKSPLYNFKPLINYDLSNYNNEYLELMMELVKEYLEIYELENSYHKRINIILNNPNTWYSIINGFYSLGSINWQLITDGEYEHQSNNDMTKCKNPYDETEFIKINDSTNQTLKIKGSTYTLEQCFINGELITTILHTKLDLNQIKDIINNKTLVYKKPS